MKNIILTYLQNKKTIYNRKKPSKHVETINDFNSSNDLKSYHLNELLNSLMIHFECNNDRNYLNSNISNWHKKQNDKHFVGKIESAIILKQNNNTQFFEDLNQILKIYNIKLINWGGIISVQLLKKNKVITEKDFRNLCDAFTYILKKNNDNQKFCFNDLF